LRPEGVVINKKCKDHLGELNDLLYQNMREPLRRPLSIGFWLAVSIFNTVRHFQRITKRICTNWYVNEPRIGTYELVCGSHGVAANYRRWEC